MADGTRLLALPLVKQKRPGTLLFDTEKTPTEMREIEKQDARNTLSRRGKAPVMMPFAVVSTAKDRLLQCFQAVSALRLAANDNAKDRLLQRKRRPFTTRQAAKSCTQHPTRDIREWRTGTYACTLLHAIFPPEQSCFSNIALTERQRKATCKLKPPQRRQCGKNKETVKCFHFIGRNI